MNKRLKKLTAFQGRDPLSYGGGAKQVYLVLSRLRKLLPDLQIEIRLIKGGVGQIFQERKTEVPIVSPYTSNVGLKGYMELILKSLFPVLNSAVIWIGVSTYRSLLIALLAKLCGRKTILRTTLIGYDDSDTILKKFRFRTGKLFLRLVDRIICNSIAVQNQYIANGFGEKVVYIPNGVDTQYYRPVTQQRKKQIRSEYGLDESRIVLIYSGAFSQRKNPAFLLKVLKQLNHEKSVYQLLLVGPQNAERYSTFDREYYNFLKAKIDELGISDHIIFDSFDESNALLYQMSDLYVTSSTAEGMPNAMLEAMACGLPVVALDLNRNLSRLIKNGINGFRIENLSVSRFTDHVGLIATDKMTLSQFGKKSRDIIENSHRIESTAEAYCQIVKTFLSRGHNGRKG